MKKKQILIISFYFAPSSRVGAKRFTFLSRILQEKYPDLHVLTIKEKYYNSRDDSLSPGGVIHRTNMHPAFPASKNNIFKKILTRLWTDYLCLVDPWSGWIFPAVTKGLRVINENRIGLIIATGPPFSTFIIGSLLKIMTKTKLVLDYRDPWSNHQRSYQNIWIKNINKVLERFAIMHSSAIVFCTEKMRDNFIKKFGKYTKANCYVANNGFENYAMIQPRYLCENKINMIYAGAFYGERKINLLIAPICTLLKEGVITKHNFCFHIFGKLSDQDKEAIKKYQLQNLFIEHSLLPHKKLITYLKGADILVLIISRNMSYSVSYKFYDYLGVKRPILAIVPENSQMQEMMKAIDCGRTAIITNQETIEKNLRAMLIENRKYSYSGSERYTWDESGKKYINIIRRLISR